MDSGEYVVPKSWNIPRMIARFWSLGPITFTAVEFLTPHPIPRIYASLADRFLTTFLLISVSGLALAWWRERLGASIAIGALILFLALYWLVYKEFFLMSGGIWLGNVLCAALLFFISKLQGVEENANMRRRDRGFFWNYLSA